MLIIRKFTFANKNFTDVQNIRLIDKIVKKYKTNSLDLLYAIELFYSR